MFILGYRQGGARRYKSPVYRALNRVKLDPRVQDDRPQDGGGNIGSRKARNNTKAAKITQGQRWED